MVAVIELNGKQHTIQPGKTLVVDRVDVEAGQTLTVKNLINGSDVTVEVVNHGLDDKVMTRKFRNKTRYHRVRGHRQPISMLTLKDEVKPAKAAKKETVEAA